MKDDRFYLEHIREAIDKIVVRACARTSPRIAISVVPDDTARQEEQNPIFLGLLVSAL
jgi:hypothetical protein